MGGPDHGAHAREPSRADQLLAQLVHHPRDVVPKRPAIGEDEILNIGAALVRGLDHAKDPGAFTTARGQERLERVPPEIGVERHRVRERRPVAAR